MTTDRALRLARWLLPAAALCALACALFAPAEARRAAQLREPPPRDPEAVTATVRGRVLYDDTERPARRARIMLVAEGGARTEHYATTDARGEFRIANVRAGSYYAFVDAPGVLSPVAFISLGDLRTSNGPGMPDLGEGRDLFELIEVKGKEDAVVTVRARRGATLSGRVTYADGDPAVNVTVNLMRRDAAGRLQKFLTGINMVSMSGLRTDDRGMYRLSGLPPGEYVVGVSEPVSHTPEAERQRPDHMPDLLEALAGQQLLMTFHPSTTSAKEAAVVKVAAGEERTDVDVRIPERELRTVAGVVLSRRDGRPLKGARVAIVRRDDPVGAPGASDLYDLVESTRNGTTTDEEGRWQFTEIPDGPYTISVRPADEYEPAGGTAAGVTMNSPMPNDNRVPAAENRNTVEYRPPRRKRGHAPARRDVEVAGDASDVTFELGDGGRVSGVITSEGGAGVVYASVSLLRVAEGGAGASQEARSADVSEGRFSAEGLPAGRYFVQPGTYGEEAKLYVKSVTWNGKDLTREPLVLGEGATAEGVQIVFARGPAELRVKALGAGDRRPVLYALVTLLPAGGGDDAPPAQVVRPHTCWTAEDGVCTLKAAPGEYRVVARSRRSLREGGEAEAARRAAAAPLVSLRAGETRELEAVVPDR